MSRYLHGIDEYAVVADEAVVGHMHIRHQQAVFSNGSFELVSCTAANGNKLPDNRILTNMGFRFFSGKFEILRHRRDRGAGIDLHIPAQPGAVPQNYVGADPASVIDDYIFMNRGKRFDNDIVTDLCLGVYVG